MKRFSISSVMSLSAATVVALTAVGFSTAECAAEEVTNLVVELKSGEQECFILADKPVLTFDLSDCTFTTAAYTVTYDMGDITRAYFSDQKSTHGLDSVVDQIDIDLSNSGKVIVSGLKPGLTVSIYDLEGRMVAGATASSDGIATVNIEHLPNGAIYVAAISNLKNFKIYKR